MASQLVGLENIPNVYITKINLEDNNNQTYGLNIFLQINDKKENNRYIWSGEETFFNFLRVGLIKTSDPTLIGVLTNGVQSPYPPELLKSSFWNSKSSLDVISLHEFQKTETQTGKEFQKKIDSLVNFQQTDLTIFAFCYLDTVGLGDLFGIELTGELKQYFGALTSEKILENGSIVKLTNIFLNSDSSVWTGPVHYHAGTGYMAGSIHSSKPHGALTRLVVQNIKLSDNRTKIFKSRETTSTPTNAIVSDLHYSLNNEADMLGLFSINCKQLALTKTKHGRKMFNASRRLFNEFLETIQINSISIIRQQVKTILVKNKIGSPKIGTEDFSSYKYLTTTMDMQGISQLQNTDLLQEIYLNSDSMIRNFQFQDNEMTAKDSGQYRYEVEISIIDKSQNFIRKKIDDLNRKLDRLQTIVEFLNRSKNYDYKLKRLKNGVNVPSEMLDIIRLYYTTLSYYNQIEEAEVENLISERLGLLLDGSYRPSHGERFLKDYQNLNSVFQRKYKVYCKYNVTTKAKNIMTSFMPNLISFKKTFTPIVNFDEFRRSYDYLGIEGNKAFAQMTKQQFLDRGTQEVERFFDTSQTLINEDIENLDTQVAQALTDIKSAQNSYLTPLKFEFDHHKIDIDLAKTDATNLTNVFLKSNVVAIEAKPKFRIPFRKKRSRRKKGRDKRSNRQFFRKNRKRNRFSFSRVPSRFNIVKPTEEDASAESQKYLGENSTFNAVSTNYEEPPTDAELKAQQALVEATVQLITPRSKLKYDIEAPNSVIDTYSNSKTFSPEVLRNAPLAFKALVCSRALGVKNNILESETDILVDPEFKTLSEMFFQTSQKIEVLSGYARDANNEPMLSVPIWEPMNIEKIEEKDSVICRMVYEENPSLGLQTTESFKLPVQNSVFVISSKDLKARDSSLMKTEPPLASDTNVNTKNELSRNIKYATTNIITQSSKKDSISKNIPQTKNTTQRTTRQPTRRPPSLPTTRGNY